MPKRPGPGPDLDDMDADLRDSPDERPDSDEPTRVPLGAELDLHTFLPGECSEIVTDQEDRLELAYATDTLISALDHAPELLRARTLIMECTFLDERKSLEAARAGCHIHLDEVVERADQFANEHVVLMHFSQIYRPDEIPGILDARLPPALRAKVIPFAPLGPHWPG